MSKTVEYSFNDYNSSYLSDDDSGYFDVEIKLSFEDKPNKATKAKVFEALKGLVKEVKETLD